MTIQKAIKSGKPFSKDNGGNWYIVEDDYFVLLSGIGGTPYPEPKRIRPSSILADWIIFKGKGNPYKKIRGRHDIQSV